MDRDEVLRWLKQRGTKRQVAEMARYGIVTRDPAFGVSVGALRALAKRRGRDHALALALWKSGYYEARLLAAFVDEPAKVTRRQMDVWSRDFDNWGVCDTVCFHLFDQTPYAWEKARAWSASPREFVKRAAFALMASLGGHDKAASDAQFLTLLPLIEKGARDERNFVKKGVSWALRRIGGRSRTLHAAATATSKRLAQSESAACRWVGKDALRDLMGPKTRARLARATR